MRGSVFRRLSVVLVLGVVGVGMFFLTVLSRRGVVVRSVVAVVLFVVILAVGRRLLVGFGGPPHERHEGAPEEVEALDVYFVCGECGTEYKVTKLGELNVPRHCGEPMQVIRRPAPDASLN
ncbi:MAG: hypothetical protein LC722_04460 [Actinobacteria bacterium]|nr:hypothetical protein [Actinomycetota bacterium]